VEQCLETVLATEPARHVRRVLPVVGGVDRNEASRADVRFNRRAGACLDSRGHRAQETQALGGLREGFSTKVHPKTDFSSVDFQLIVGEADNSRWCNTAPDIGPAPRLPINATTPGQIEMPPEGAASTPQHRTGRPPENGPSSSPSSLTRAALGLNEPAERRFKRIALRCEKITPSCARPLVFGLILIKSVHTPYAMSGL
jgi:hypothetical protein